MILQLTLRNIDLYDLPRLDSSTSITEIDENIVNRLKNIESLNISYNRITDLKFMLNIPNIKEFKYYQHSINGVDVSCLKGHPNYRDEWLTD